MPTTETLKGTVTASDGTVITLDGGAVLDCYDGCEMCGGSAAVMVYYHKDATSTLCQKHYDEIYGSDVSSITVAYRTLGCAYNHAA